eukprot:TRINITY_DN10387_c0_g6_i3.p1 TRINITY_DN10387_c0_g6~~TRINITY_DN10387_c0_g6_i3.p1  ORF type:complete len:236 (-),score=11.08 TRINITY_DN10387_c0_g6_i3:120-803(-)
MIRRPPRSTQSRSSAASDVYKRQPIACCQRRSDSNLLKKALRPLNASRHSASRNADGFKVGVGSVFIKANHRATSMKTVGLETAVGSHTTHNKLYNTLFSGAQHKENVLNEHFPQLPPAKFRRPAFQIAGTDRIQLWNNTENKLKDGQVYTKVLRTDQSLLGRRDKMSMVSPASLRGRLKNQRNFVRINRIKLNSIYQKIQNIFQQETKAENYNKEQNVNMNKPWIK